MVLIVARPDIKHLQCFNGGMEKNQTHNGLLFQIAVLLQ